MQRLLLLFFVFSLCGCAQAIQKAVIGGLIEIPPPATAAMAPSPSSLGAAENSARVSRATVLSPSQLPVSTASLTRFVVRAEASQLMVNVGDFFGTYPARMKRFRGQLFVPEHDDAASASVPSQVKFTFDMTSVESRIGGVTECLQADFLEVDRFPTATLDATVTHATASSKNREDVIVDGYLTLHGQRRHISFKGTMMREADGYHFKSIFDLDRRPFKIHRSDVWDNWANDMFRVEMNLHATPEHVTAETVD